jgi:hypothetical protein
MPDLDNTSKRRSSVQILMTPILAPPAPDGTISQADRQHIAWTYSGILAAQPAAGQPFMKRTQGIPTGPGSRDRPGRWN